jgi:ferredoxin
MDDEGLAKPIDEELSEELAGKATEAADDCPVAAITVK